MGGFQIFFFFLKEFFKKEPDQRMKFRRTNKVAKFEIKKVKNEGAVSKNGVRVAISLSSPYALWTRRGPVLVQVTLGEN